VAAIVLSKRQCDLSAEPDCYIVAGLAYVPGRRIEPLLELPVRVLSSV
jgi:hypothetical protein